MFEQMQAGDILRHRVEATPERRALVASDTGEAWSYRHLDDAVEETARALQARARTATPRVAAALSTAPEFVVVIHATLRLGWELVPLNTGLSVPELAAHVRRSAPEICLCDRTTEAETTAALADAGREAETTLLSVERPNATDAEALLTDRETFDSTGHALGDTALLLFTSGTTGEPKAVQLTPKNLLSSAIASAFRLGVSPTDRWLCCLPMYHMGGFAPAIRSVLYGTTLVLQRSFDAEETARVIDEEAITGVSLVPTQLTRLLDAGLSGTHLQTVLLGGAPASEELLERAREADIPVCPTYGLTETASQVATARPAESAEYPGTVGQPLFGTRVRIVADGRRVPVGEQGEIVVDGPTVTPGYLDEGQTEKAFSEWGLHTGDVGYRDDDGRLWVVGRKDEMIITGGELVSPVEVTEAIRAVSGVSEAAVVGVDDPEWGQRVGAVVANDGEQEVEVLRERISHHCEQVLAGYKRPKTMDLVEEIPRTHSGTVDREAVRELLRGDDA